MTKWPPILAVLFTLCITIWFGVISLGDKKLHLIACDVGQGDAILVTYKNTQLLIDGGPANGGVLSCLSKYMPFWDREIEAIILTNPDLDHYGGLIEVLARYRVANFIESPVPDSTQSYQLLQKRVGSSGARIVPGGVGTTIRYGLISLDIVSPDPKSVGFATASQNNNSAITLVKFGNFEALLTGDAEEEASDFIAEKINLPDVDYIKVNHHGSRNGLTAKLLDKVKPEMGVISVGKKNRYGHPHKDILDLLDQYNVQKFRTDESGDIHLVSDGTTSRVVSKSITIQEWLEMLF